MQAESLGCRNAWRRARAFLVLPCAFPALRGSTPRRAAQGRTGNARAAQPGAKRAALRAHSAALRREGRYRASQGRRAAPREKETIGGETENGNRSQDQGRTDAASLGEERR